MPKARTTVQSAVNDLRDFRWKPAPGMKVLNAEAAKKIDELLSLIANTAGHGSLTIEVRDGNYRFDSIAFRLAR